MIQMNEMEIDAVSGALSLIKVFAYGNAIIEFGKGFIKGVEAGYNA